MEDSSDVRKKDSKAMRAFKQQKLPAWQPILTPGCVLPSLIIIGVIFIPVGIGLFAVSNQVQERSIRYDNYCFNQSKCQVKFENLSMTQPVYLYYELTNFYQNHRRYVKSRSDAQLKGDEVKLKADLATCDPYISLNGSSDPNLFYLPCGLIAKSIFTDVFLLKTEGGRSINVTKKGISWEYDINTKYNNPPANAPGIRTIPDFKDEDFVVWMRPAGLPKFRKLYRIIQENLNGTYVVDIDNNYEVSSFTGTKSVVISQTSFLGGKNVFLGIAYIIVGGVCLFAGILFTIIHFTVGRSPGDLSYIIPLDS